MKQMIQDTEASRDDLATVLTQMANYLLQQDARALAEKKVDAPVSQEPEFTPSADKEAEQ